jgi:hypothetical protein
MKINEKSSSSVISFTGIFSVYALLIVGNHVVALVGEIELYVATIEGKKNTGTSNFKFTHLISHS